MIEKELENITREQKAKGLHDAYIRNVLKEYLQAYVLFYIYTSPQYKQQLIFTGGTCLRHFYDLQRLSEDIDFDYLGVFSPKDFLEELKVFFVSKYQYREMSSSLKQEGNQVLLKFPVLKKLGLSGASDSDFLYIRVDLSKLPSENYSTLVTSKSSFGFNYAARHYDLPSLMAGKLHAILARKYQRGKQSRNTIKGRDYFDLLWFLKQGVSPNLRRLSDMLGEEMNFQTLEKRVDQKVDTFMKEHKKDYTADMIPLIKDPGILEIYTESYQEEYLRFKAESFSQHPNRVSKTDYK